LVSRKGLAIRLQTQVYISSGDFSDEQKTTGYNPIPFNVSGQMVYGNGTTLGITSGEKNALLIADDHLEDATVYYTVDDKYPEILKYFK
jgi:hypothetical protein